MAFSLTTRCNMTEEQQEQQKQRDNDDRDRCVIMLMPLMLLISRHYDEKTDTYNMPFLRALAYSLVASVNQPNVTDNQEHYNQNRPKMQERAERLIELADLKIELL